jgi:hypothetical protein
MGESAIGRIEAVQLDIQSASYADLTAIYHYWNGKRCGRLAPKRRDIDPVDLVDVLPRIMLIDVDGNPPRFRYRLSGTAIGHTHGTEPTGKTPLDLPPAPYGQLLERHYRECVERKEPSLYLIVLDTLDRSRAYARLLLPFSEDGATVSMLMTIDSRYQDSEALTDFFALAANRMD